MQIQYAIKRENREFVVICFKFSNFAYANTVGYEGVRIHAGLLFALNLVTLLMQIQCGHFSVFRTGCCYLL